MLSIEFTTKNICEEGINMMDVDGLTETLAWLHSMHDHFFLSYSNLKMSDTY